MFEHRNFRSYFNSLKNFEYLLCDSFIDTISYTQSNCILVAGGSLLDHYISDLQSIYKQYNTIIISCSSAYKTLYLNNIIPDYVIIADESRYELKNNGFYSTDSTLIYDPRIRYEITSSFKYRKVMNCKNYLLTMLTDVIPPNPIYNGTNIATIMIQIASILQFKKIFLIGYDFCYYNKQSHSSLHRNEYGWRTLHQLQDRNNIQCETTEALLIFRQETETILSQYNNIYQDHKYGLFLPTQFMPINSITYKSYKSLISHPNPIINSIYIPLILNTFITHNNIYLKPVSDYKPSLIPIFQHYIQEVFSKCI